MPPAAATGPRPSPQAAYAQWTDACAAAGWRGTPAAQLMRAHAWWPIPIGQGKFARGEQIDVQLIPGAPR
jgi:hypothetical protein